MVSRANCTMSATARAWRPGPARTGPTPSTKQVSARIRQLPVARLAAQAAGRQLQQQHEAGRRRHHQRHHRRRRLQLPAGPVGRGPHVTDHTGDDRLDRGREQRFLGLEVPVDAALGRPAPGCHVADRDVAVAAGREQVDGGRHDALPGGVGHVGPAGQCRLPGVGVERLRVAAGQQLGQDLADRGQAAAAGRAAAG